MVVLGLILLLLGWLLGVGLLKALGAILICVGVVLLLVGTAGPIGNRWW